MGNQMLPFTGMFILFTSGGDTISHQSQQQYPPPQGARDCTYRWFSIYPLLVANYLATCVLLSSNHIANRNYEVESQMSITVRGSLVLTIIASTGCNNNKLCFFIQQGLSCMINVTVLLLFVYIAVQSAVQSTSSLPISSTPASSRSSTGEG